MSFKSIIDTVGGWVDGLGEFAEDVGSVIGTVDSWFSPEPATLGGVGTAPSQQPPDYGDTGGPLPPSEDAPGPRRQQQSGEIPLGLIIVGAVGLWLVLK